MRALFIVSQVNAIRLQGIEHVISFAVTDDNVILFRSYKIHLKKSGLKIPRIELTEIGNKNIHFKHLNKREANQITTSNSNRTVD